MSHTEQNRTGCGGCRPYIWTENLSKEEISLDVTQGRGKHFHGMHNFPLDLAYTAPGLKDFRGCQEPNVILISSSNIE